MSRIVSAEIEIGIDILIVRCLSGYKKYIQNGQYYGVLPKIFSLFHRLKCRLTGNQM